MLLFSLVSLQAQSWRLTTICTVWATGERRVTVDQTTALDFLGSSHRWECLSSPLKFRVPKKEQPSLEPVFDTSFLFYHISCRVLQWRRKRKRPGMQRWSRRSGNCGRRANTHTSTFASAAEKEESWWCVTGRTAQKRITCCVSTSPNRHTVTTEMTFCMLLFSLCCSWNVSAGQFLAVFQGFFFFFNWLSVLSNLLYNTMLSVMYRKLNQMY